MLSSLFDEGSSLVCLITSGARLGLKRECLFEVAPLEEADATRVFLQQARLVRPDLDVEGEAVQRIVALSEGLPLALELAASRVGVLSLRAIADHLSESFDLLYTGPSSGGRASAPSLWRSVAAACSALTVEEASLLERLSVFDGFDAAAVMAVSDGLEAQAMAVLESLRGKSLIRTLSTKGAVRFRLLGPIRRYAQARLAVNAAAAESAHLAHAAHYVKQAERGADAAGLSEEAENLELVIGRSLSGELTPAGAHARRIFIGAESRHWMRLLPPAVIELLDATLALTSSPGDRARLLLRRSKARQAVSDNNASNDARLALELGEEHDLPDVRGLALARLGTLRAVKGDLDGGARLLNDAIATLQRQEHASLLADAHTQLGNILRLQGQLDLARLNHERALEHRLRLNHERGAALDRLCLGLISLERGACTHALEMLTAAEGAFRRLGDYSNVTVTSGSRGIALRDLGRLEEAERALQEAVKLGADTGNRRHSAIYTAYLGTVAFERGEPESAVRLFAEGIIGWIPSDYVHASLFYAATSVVYSSMGRLGDALAALDDARACARNASGADTTLDAATGIASAAVLVLNRKQRHAEGEAAAALGGQVTEVMRRYDVTANINADIRMLHRWLQVAHAHVAQPAGGRERRVDAPAPSGARVLVSEDGRWFETSEGKRVDISRRGPARLMLAALARARSSGAPLEAAELIACAWPGERMIPQAAMSRLYVTIQVLRDLGLRTVLLRVGTGYQLSVLTQVA